MQRVFVNQDYYSFICPHIHKSKDNKQVPINTCQNKSIKKFHFLIFRGLILALEKKERNFSLEKRRNYRTNRTMIPAITISSLDFVSDFHWKRFEVAKDSPIPGRRSSNLSLTVPRNPPFLLVARLVV